MTGNTDQGWAYRFKKVENLYLAAEGSSATDYFPYFYAETRIDFNDVRTGYRDAVNLRKALKIYADRKELFLTDDMILDVDSWKIQAIPPDTARMQPLPEFVDGTFLTEMESRYIEYLTRYFTIRLYRSFALNTYSGAGESRADFINRCLESLRGEARIELDRLSELFSRKQEQLKEKYLTAPVPLSSAAQQAQSGSRNIYLLYSERMTALFLKENTLPAIPPGSRGNGNRELEERLIDVELEARRAIADVMKTFEEQASALDEYLIHPRLKDIHFVRSCVLWMPRKAE